MDTVSAAQLLRCQAQPGLQALFIRVDRIGRWNEDAVLLIAEATGGILRKINILATACLEEASEGRGTVIDAGVVQKGVEQCAEALA